MTRRKNKGPYAKRKGRFASIFEEGVHNRLSKRKKYLKFTHQYEVDKIPYTIEHVYNPDFTITNESGKVWYLEAKGWFKPADRRKHKALKLSNPDADIRIVFQKDGRVGVKTKYSDWCNNLGIPYCIGDPPKEWFEE